MSREEGQPQSTSITRAMNISVCREYVQLDLAFGKCVSWRLFISALFLCAQCLSLILLTL